jgi:hypothetical protein
LLPSRSLCAAALGVVLAVPARADEPAGAAKSAPAAEPALRATSEALPRPLPTMSPQTMSPQTMKLVEPFTTQYWLRVPDGLSAFRDEPEIRLRLDVETYRVRSGPLVLTTSLEIAPSGEGSMPAQGPPSASARVNDSHGLPRSTSVMELKVDLGDVGPLQRVGPSLKVGAPAGRPKATNGFLRLDIGGAW